MKILEVRPPGRLADLCVFDVQIGEHLRLYNLALRRLDNGYYRILAPRALGKHVASFAPTLAHEITEKLMSQIGGAPAYDQSRAT